MSVTTQAYEWMNLAPVVGGVSAQEEVGRSVNARPVTIPPNLPVDIFVGGYGNNVTMPSLVRSTDFVVLEYLSCTPYRSSAVNIRVNTTDYFQLPDLGPSDANSQTNGIPALAIPYPCGSPNDKGDPTNLSAVTMPFFNLNPSIYILPGQTWTATFTTLEGVTGSVDNGAVGTTIGVAIQFTSYNGSDALISQKLLGMGIPITSDNVDWYKRELILQGEK
jgi:hypothetical protein|tara:strand:- start:16039 stop:16698 length:660 start_codon:yes stop_codon:yes gene_type:complete